MITVIVPVFNKSAYIERSIISVLGQSYTDFELLLIDDGSTDNSKNIIDSIILNDSRCKYYFQKNQGVSSARNYGLKLAKGSHIAFLDADDEYSPNFLSNMLSAIKDGDATYCAHYIGKHSGKIKSRFNFFNEDLLYGYLTNQCTPNTNSWLINKEFLIRNNIKFKSGICWGEDMMFFSEVIVKANKIYPCREYLTIYNMGLMGSLSVNSMDKIKEDIFWMSYVKDLIINSNLSEDYKLRCAQVVECYRIPAGIIYRIFENTKLLSQTEFLNSYLCYYKYMKGIRIINGLRSLKLYFLFNMLRIRYIYYRALLS
ncbi:glycosyltransferase family 2 protein [bacterium SPL81]|nr:glycosyltransferase family 2 protein [Acinetobacter baumannii]